MTTERTTTPFIRSPRSDYKRDGMWSERDDEIITRLYPGGGSVAVRQVLTDRSKQAVQRRASILGVRMDIPNAKSFDPETKGLTEIQMELLWRLRREFTAMPGETGEFYTTLLGPTGKRHSDVALGSLATLRRRGLAHFDGSVWRATEHEQDREGDCV